MANPEAFILPILCFPSSLFIILTLYSSFGEGNLLNRRRFRYKVCAVAEEEGRYGRTERGKRGRKRRQLWEELLEDNNVEDDDDVDVGGDSGKIDLWKILEEIVDNVWILKVPHLCVGCLN